MSIKCLAQEPFDYQITEVVLGVTCNSSVLALLLFLFNFRSSNKTILTLIPYFQKHVLQKPLFHLAKEEEILYKKAVQDYELNQEISDQKKLNKIMNLLTYGMTVFSVSCG